ncbi:MAG: hypothetical protein KatS3mg060_0710 [Dehalococcoidia bacterium]|nr:MAG: hypothetical protein KatS3mg060_0710 [Dehalococcoidia bacterium]
MNSIFGVSTTLVLLVLAALALGMLALLAVAVGRGAILLRVGLRNVPRRPLRTALVTAGLAVSTAVLTSAFTTGDTMTSTIRLLVTSQVGRVDELIVLYRRQAQSIGPQDIVQIATGQLVSGSRAYFNEREYDRLVRALGEQPAIAALTPAIVEPMVAANPASQQVGSHLNVIGLPSQGAGLFDEFYDASKRRYQLRDLGPNDVYLNAVAATMLGAKEGDELLLYFGQERPRVVVGAIVSSEAIGDGQPALVMPLGRLQALVARPREINRILIANAGDAVTSVERSGEVVRALRGVLVRDEVARAMHEILHTEVAQSEMVKALAQSPPSQRPKLEALMAASREPTVTPEFKSLLGDPDIIGRISFVSFLLRGTPQGGRLNDQLRQLTGLTVLDIKRAALDRAEEYGAVLTSIFFVVGILAIAAALALVFLVFVLLAAERRSEMGVSRAIGMRRGQLVATFLYEGLAYDLVGALLGVGIGVAAGVAAVNLVSGWLVGYGVAIQPYVAPRSLAITYLAGVLLTFLAVGGAAWRVSRLNVVAAIRDLPDAPSPSLAALFLQPTRLLAASLHRPALLLRLPGALGAIGWRLTCRGPALIAIGLGLRAAGLAAVDWAAFALGVSLTLLGAALVGRWIVAALPNWANRLVMSAGALAQLAWWLDAWSVFGFGHWPFPEPNVGAFALRGLATVTALVWLASANLTVALGAMTLVVRPVRPALPALRLAVTYPAVRPWRTAMALMMFALVIFTMTLATVLLNVAIVAYADPTKAQLGYDIRGEPAQGGAAPDIRAGLATAVAIKETDFAAIGTLYSLPAEVLDLAEPAAAWRPTPVSLLDSEFAQQIPLRLVAWSPQFPSAELAWRAVIERSNAALLVSRDPITTTAFTPSIVWVREPRGGTPVKLELVGRVDPSAGLPPGIVAPLTAFAHSAPEVRSYFFRVRPDVRVEDAALGLTLSFGDAGLRTQIVGQEAARAAAIRAVLTSLLQVFLGLGLIAGLAALGILGVMAVVERRSHIGVLRAIGYRKWLVMLAFLLESALTALLGILLGGVAGVLLAAQITRLLARGRPEIQLVIPWSDLAIIVAVAGAAALLTALLPAQQAGAVRPAEAIKS